MLNADRRVLAVENFPLDGQIEHPFHQFQVMVAGRGRQTLVAEAGMDQLLVAYDELDLPPGTARLKLGGGHGGHNGMRDIFRHTVSQDFMRLRIGIGHPGHKSAVTGYVLSRPTADQERSILESIDHAANVLPRVLDGDLPGAMKELHTEKNNGL